MINSFVPQLIFTISWLSGADENPGGGGGSYLHAKVQRFMDDAKWVILQIQNNSNLHSRTWQCFRASALHVHFYF